MSVIMEPEPSRVLILLCTYNECLNMQNMVTQLHTALPQADILVVDDNSPDGTGAWVQQAAATDSRMHLLARQGKFGLGSATRDGLRWCLDRNYEFLINLDADLSHRPADTARLLAACQQPNCDVSVASRYLPGGGFTSIAAHRRLMSWTLNRYANWLLKLPLTDCSGSFRCYRTSALRRIDLGKLTCVGYGFLEEILVALNQAGCRFVEVPIWFDARSMGRSKLSIKDAWGAIKLIHQLRNR
jgi:dolichol-phosphate mannosyltransferase